MIMNDRILFGFLHVCMCLLYRRREKLSFFSLHNLYSLVTLILIFLFRELLASLGGEEENEDRDEEGDEGYERDEDDEDDEDREDTDDTSTGSYVNGNLSDAEGEGDQEDYLRREDQEEKVKEHKRNPCGSAERDEKIKELPTIEKSLTGSSSSKSSAFTEVDDEGSSRSLYSSPTKLVRGSKVQNTRFFYLQIYLCMCSIRGTVFCLRGGTNGCLQCPGGRIYRIHQCQHVRKREQHKENKQR